MIAVAAPVNESLSQSAIHKFALSRLQTTPAGAHVCCFDDGFDRGLHDSAGRQFHQDVVADFVFEHCCDIL
jgi:hypothetical protein